MIVGHHTGTLLEPLGNVADVGGGETRWADWIDLVLPYVVVGCAAGALAASATPRRVWLLFGVAAVLYTQGHGIHLAANSIANVAPGEPADPGTSSSVTTCGTAGSPDSSLRSDWLLGDLPRPSWRISLPVALLFGFTVFTNSIEGGTAPLGIATSGAFLAWGLYGDGSGWPGCSSPLTEPPSSRSSAGGSTGSGFPQFSELGWL